MKRKTFAKFACHHYFHYISCNIYHEADCEYQNALIEGVFAGKCGSSAQPEKKNIRIKCIDQKSGRKYLCHFSFAETEQTISRILQFYLFKENVKYSHD